MTSATLPAAGTHVVAPYITAWSAEEERPGTLVERPGQGIAYADETVTDRDRHGVLWRRTRSARRRAGRCSARCTRCGNDGP